MRRQLGEILIESGLSAERLKKALDHQKKRGGRIGTLLIRLNFVKEEDVLQYLVDNEGSGLVDLRNCEVHDELRKTIDVGACWATWSVPFDREEDFTFIATAYYLSPAVRAYWEKQFGTAIVWYGTTLEILADFLEKLETERGPAKAAAVT